MNKIIIWGFNEYTKHLIENNKFSIECIFDKFTTITNYKDIEIINDINLLKDKDKYLYVVASTTYFFEIKKEIQDIHKNIEIIYIGDLLESYPKTIFIENMEELKSSVFINCSIYGDVIIDNGLIVQLLHNIPISINVSKNATLYFNNNVLMDGVEISLKDNAKISLGERTYINKYGIIRSNYNINIGKDCAIAWNVTIMDNDGYSIGNKTVNNIVIIEDNVWIGNNVNILKNTHISEGCSVGSMSKVKGKFKSNSLIVGSPAKMIKENIKWK